MAGDCFSSAIGTSSSDYCGYQAPAGVRKRITVGCAHVWVQQGAAVWMQRLGHELALDSGAAMARDGDRR